LTFARIELIFILNTFSLFKTGRPSMYETTYYVSYLGICAALIFWLARILNRSGAIFLHDSFGDKEVLIRSIAHLLDIGFYLLSFGYVALSIRVNWQIWPNETLTQVLGFELGEIGGFLLLLGFVHLFNLLLAIFRRRTVVSPTPAAL
jgi:hypothetical protein